MKETEFRVVVLHAKPLPDGAKEVLAQRFYNWAYSQGVQVGVRVHFADAPENADADDHPAIPAA